MLERIFGTMVGFVVACAFFALAVLIGIPMALHSLDVIGAYWWPK